MAVLSSSSLLVAGFIAYVAYCIYGVTYMFATPHCTSKQECLTYFLHDNPEMQLWAVITPDVVKGRFPEVAHVAVYDHFNYSVESERVLKDIKLPLSTRQNGTLYLWIFFVPHKLNVKSWDEIFSHNDYVHTVLPLTSYQVPLTTAFDLLKGEKESNVTDKPITHLKSIIGFNIVTDLKNFPQTDIPGELYPHLKIKRSSKILLPIIHHDFFDDRLENLVPINGNDTVEILLKYAPINIGHLRFTFHIEAGFDSVKKYGFSEKDVDQLKSVFGDTNLFLLCVTFFVASIHMLLDFLAMKNDVTFWKRRKTLIGVSLRTVLWRAFSQIIILLYLLDEQTSLLVLIPNAITAVIELWKVHKVLPFDWRQMKFKEVTLSEGEKRTRQLDAQGMEYLTLVLYPICILGALYSLLYEHHRSWYSWTIHSLVNGVYAFGFLFMLPQLFINYKLKSVAHLPWRAFMYKAFNTFIDDLFAFIITMPTAHRIACFRDDVVFLIYLYQRWLYPVDGSRTDEAYLND